MTMEKIKCPLGHEQTKQLELVDVRGVVFGMPKKIVICEVCGVLFDWGKQRK